MDQVKKFLLKLELINNYPKKLKFLFYIEDSNFKNLPQKSLKWIITHLLHFSYFLLNSKNQIYLVSLEWFSEKACSQQQIKVLNIFDKKLKKWSKTFDVEEKFRNFYQCPLIYLVFYQISIFHTAPKKEGGEVVGLLIDLPHIVSARGNASTIIQFPINYNIFKPSKNLTSHIFTGIKAIDMMVNPDEGSHVTTYYDDTSYGFIITPSEKYSSYEKLILPFDEITWKFLILIFVIAFIIIFIINRLPEIIQIIFYGTTVKDNMFNLIRAFFGMSQDILPVENFPRILLIVFITFCFVMRTAYQGNKMLELKTQNFLKF